MRPKIQRSSVTVGVFLLGHEIRRTEICGAMFIPTGSSTYHQMLSISRRPHLVLIFLQHPQQSSYFEMNPFNYRHFGISNVSFKMTFPFEKKVALDSIEFGRVRLSESFQITRDQFENGISIRNDQGECAPRARQPLGSYHVSV